MTRQLGSLAGTPAVGDGSIATVRGSEEGSIRPGQIAGGDGGAVLASELLGQGAVGGRVLLHDGEESIGVGLDSLGDVGVGRGRARVVTRGSRGNEVLEEWKTGVGDGERALLLPLVEGIVQLLGGRGGRQVPVWVSFLFKKLSKRVRNIPWVTSLVDVLGVTTNSNSGTGLSVLVHTIDRAERVNNGLVVAKSAGRAGLEGSIVAGSSRVESLNRAQNRVDIDTGARSLDTQVGNDGSAIPEALQEATQLRSLGIAVLTRLAQGLGERSTLDQRTVLGGDGEERRTSHFFPQIAAGRVPVLGDVREVVLHDGPDVVLDGGLLALGDQVVAVGDERSCAQGRAITLGTTPGTSERGPVHIVLGLSESRSVGKNTRGVGDSLQLGLGSDVLLDEGLQGLVAGNKALDQDLEGQGGVAGPGEEIYRSLFSAIFIFGWIARSQSGFALEGDATTIPSEAPFTSFPWDPMLLRTP